MSWKFPKDFTVHWFKQNKKRKKGETHKQRKCRMCCLRTWAPTRKPCSGNPWSSSSHWCVCLPFVYNLVSPNVWEMPGFILRCLRWEGPLLVSLEPTVQLLGGGGWTLPGNIDLHRLFCKRNDWLAPCWTRASTRRPPASLRVWTCELLQHSYC